MRAFTALILLTALQAAAMSQPLGDTYWNKIKERADSVVISRFGATFFGEHIFPPMDLFDFIALGEYTISWRDRDTVTTPPVYCHFEYDIGFDPLNASRLNIMLNITPDGALIEDADLRGFILSPAPLHFSTDLDGFIQLARMNDVKCDRRTAFRELRWLPLDTTARLHPGGNGRYELVLGRIRKKKMTKQLSNSTYTYQVVDAIVFDPFTGEVLRKEERHETLSVACGVGSL